MTSLISGSTLGRLHLLLSCVHSAANHYNPFAYILWLELKPYKTTSHLRISLLIALIFMPSEMNFMDYRSGTVRWIERFVLE